MGLKKVLVLDDAKVSIERLTLLINSVTNFEIDTSSDTQTAIKLFDNNTYDFIVLEHNCKNSDKFMNHTLSLNPKQKMILLSDSINCPVDCDICLERFKFVRLLKPITMDNVVKYIADGDDENFTCPNQYRFDDIDTLEKLYEFIYLDENYYFTEKELNNDALYIRTKLSGTIRFDELVKVQNLINKKYFKVIITEDNSIVISKI